MATEKQISTAYRLLANAAKAAEKARRSKALAAVGLIGVPEDLSQAERILWNIADLVDKQRMA